MSPIAQQLAFLAELDKLKSVLRASPLVNGSRKENSAEHSWHIAMFAFTLAEHSGGADILRVIKMLLLHDIVEIDAGDVPFFATGGDKAAEAKTEREAADRIFGMLPPEQGTQMLTLWLEFEAAETKEARFAKAIDRLQPLLINTLTNGGTWNDFGVTEKQAMDRYGAIISRGSPALWEEASRLVAQHFAEQRKKA
jgi:putative hydrolases of HD superfamily